VEGQATACYPCTLPKLSMLAWQCQWRLWSRCHATSASERAQLSCLSAKRIYVRPSDGTSTPHNHSTMTPVAAFTSSMVWTGLGAWPPVNCSWHPSAYKTTDDIVVVVCTTQMIMTRSFWRFATTSKVPASLLLLLLVFSAQRQVLSHWRQVSLSCAFSFSFA